MIGTIGELLDLLSTSRLLPDEELQQLRRATVDSSSPSNPAAPNPAEVVQRLVARGRLSRYQGDELLAGRVDRLRLGNYVLLDVLGQGGMGTVYRARHERMKREVAIKTLPPDAVASESAVRRFHREVEVAAQLQHPRIVAAYDADEADGVNFLVMEYVRGESLAEHVNRQGPISVPRAVDYLIQAAEGLAYAHREGVIHRDIKPANLLLDREGRVKILDMGLARPKAEQGSHTIAVTQDYLTQTGMVLGTVDYLAPEQARNIKTADLRADIYSLGCTLHFLLTGKPPYEGKSLMEKLAAHQKAEIPSLRGTNPEIPETLDGVFQRLVAKRREDRYASMEDVIAALRPFAGDRGGPDAGGGAAAMGTEGPDASGQTVHRRRDDTSVAAPSGASTSVAAAISGAWQRAGNRMRAAILTISVLAILAVGAFVGSRFSRHESNTRNDPSSVADRTDRGTGSPATDGDANSSTSPGGSSGPGAPPSGAPTPDSSPAPPNPPPQRPADLDREVARRVLALGGTVVAVVDSQNRTVAREADLPSGPFAVREIAVSSSDWSDDDLTLVGMLTSLVSLEQRGCHAVTDEGLQRLKNLTGLKQFLIENAAVTNGGLAHLTGNRELKILSFRNLRVDDGAVDVIKRFPSLVGLHIDTPQFSGSRMGELAGLSQLAYLSIPGGVMESQGASILAGCPQLVWLALTSPNDEAVRQAAKLPGVTDLHLGKYRGTPAGLSALATMPKLSVLRLLGDSLGDEHAARVAALTRLREIELKDQSLQPATLAQIRQALPECRLIYDGNALDGPNRSAAEWVLKRGGKITIQVTGGTPRDIAEPGQLPTAAFRVTKVDLAGVADLKDAELEPLSQLTRLESLNLSQTAITDAAMAHCERLWELRELILSETAIGDGGLASVSNVVSIRRLNLVKTPVTDAGLTHLKPLIQLDYLNLGGVQVSDAGLAQIAGAPKLRELWLNQTRITDAVTDTLKTLKSLEMAHLGVGGFTGARFDELAVLPKLSRLILGGWQGSVSPDRIDALALIPTLSYLQVDYTTDAHLAAMARLPQVKSMYIGFITPTGKGLGALTQSGSLRELTVKNVKLAEEHLQALAEFKQLERIHLADTGIDAAGVQRLTQALPNCRINVTPPPANTLATSQTAPMPPSRTEAAPTDVNREVARRVLALGGTVVVVVDSQNRTVARAADLPSGPFAVREIVVSSADWSDDDLTLVGMLESLVSLELRRCHAVTDEGLRHLKGLTGLKKFVIGDAAATNEGLAHLTGNHELEFLAIFRTRVDDGAVDLIKQFPALVALQVDTPQFTGSRLGELSGLPRLVHLRIAGHMMESQSAAILAGCPRLVSLALISPGDEALRQTAKLPSVTELLVEGYRGTPAGLSALATMPKLDVLRLLGGSLSDEHSAAVAALTRLREIELKDQSLQPTTLARIRQALPECRLIDDGNALDGPNRSAAEWVLKRGGKITIQVTEGSPRDVTQPEQLPATPFRVTKVDLAGIADLKDAELEQLSQLTRLESLNLSKAPITDAAMAHCERLWELRELILSETAIGDTGLASVSNVTSIRRLNLVKTQVTDPGLAHLKPLIQLDYLHLGGVQVSDAGLAQIAGAPRLRELWLNSTRITDAVTDTLKTLKSLELAHLGVAGFTGARFDELAAMPKLRQLFLYCGKDGISSDQIRALATTPTLSFLIVGNVSNAQLAEMARLPQVRTMEVAHSNPTGKGFAALAQSKSLRDLTVRNSGLVEEHLQALAEFKQLEKLQLADTGIDAAGVQRLTQALPNCRINVTPPPADTPSASQAAPMPSSQAESTPTDADREVARRVLALGGTVVVVVDSQNRAVAREADLPSGSFAVREITVSSADWMDSDLAAVGKLTELRTLSQWNCPALTDAGLERLQNLTGLELFAISDAFVTSAGLRHLTKNQGLKHLQFSQIVVDDDIVDVVKQFPSLMGLHFESVNLTGERLGQLSGLSKLRYLAVEGHVMATQSAAIAAGCPNLTLVQLISPNDESLRQVTNFKNVTDLTLACWGKPETTAQGLSALAGMPNLTALYFRGVPVVTDAGAEALSSLTRLRRLELQDQALSPTALAKIRQALPNCDLIYDGTALDGPNRTAAEWVLQRGGKITVQVTGGTPRDIAEPSQLPTTAFRVIKVDLAGVADLKDAELEQLSQLTRVQILNLSRTAITDAAMTNCQHLWELSRIELHDTVIGDEGLAALSRVPSLRALNLQKTRVTDAGVGHFKSLARLDWLDLGYNPITDAGLAQLAGASKLRELWLAETQITDASVDTLKTLANVEVLYLGQIKFTGTRLEELTVLPRLSRLWLSAYPGRVPAEHFSKLAGFPALPFLGVGGASDAHLSEIGRLGQIESLFLGDLNAAATGTGLAALESLDKLRSLTVYRTKLSPEYLDVLARLTRLERLELTNTDIDAAGVQRLSQALPNCKIQVTPPLASVPSPPPSQPPVKD